MPEWKTEPAPGMTEREITITRVFAAPRELVFKAWTDPQHLAQWWGPKGFTNPVCDVDLRLGGTLRIVMRAPEGIEHPMVGVFREIVAPERLVFTFMAVDPEDKPLLDGITTVTFTEYDGKTRLTVHSRAVALVTRAIQMLDGMQTGWTQSIDRLETHLEALASERKISSAPDREIVITRVFNAPRALVWEAWVNPMHVVHWWGPKGFTTTIETMEVRPGGVWKHIMHGPDGTDYPNESLFTEVVKPERIVFSHGGGRKGDLGVQFIATWSFETEGDKTRVTIHMVFPSAADRERVVKDYGAIEGGKQTLERFADYTAKFGS